jgi:hypothetical protein
VLSARLVGVRLGSEKQLRTATPSSGDTVHDVWIECWTIPAARDAEMVIV